MAEGFSLYGFIYLIFRELLSSSRSAILNRAEKVKFLKTLEFEISECSEIISHFYDSINDLIRENKNPAGVVKQEYQYRLYFKNATSDIFRQNIGKVQNVFISSKLGNYKRVSEFYEIVDAYHDILRLYKDRFGGNIALSSNKDPHERFLKKSNASGLDQCGEKRKQAIAEIKLLMDSSIVWSFLKNKYIYWSLKIILILLLIFIPDRDAI